MSRKKLVGKINIKISCKHSKSRKIGKRRTNWPYGKNSKPKMSKAHTIIEVCDFCGKTLRKYKTGY